MTNDLPSPQFVVAAAVFVLSVSSFACSGTDAAATDDEGDQADESALNIAEPIVTGVAGIVTHGIARGTGRSDMTLGEKTKVDKFIRALGVQRHRPTVACKEALHPTITFHDDKGTEIATATFTCDIGTLKSKNGDTKAIEWASYDAALDVLAAPLVPADALWAIDRVALDHSAPSSEGPARATTTDPLSIMKVKSAIDTLQRIDEHAAVPRCAPARAVTFFRRGKPVASAGYTCSLDGALAPKVDATFTIAGLVGEDPLASGVVQIKPAGLEAVYAALPQDLDAGAP